MGALVRASGMIADPSTTKDIDRACSPTPSATSRCASRRPRRSTSPAIPRRCRRCCRWPRPATSSRTGEKYPDVRLAAAMAYARLGGAAEAAAFAPVAAGEKAAIEEFKEDAAAPRGGQEVRQGRHLLRRRRSTAIRALPHQEKAAFMLARMGKDALPPLVKKLSHARADRALRGAVRHRQDRRQERRPRRSRRSTRRSTSTAPSRRCARSFRRCAPCALDRSGNQ